ncbi:hypothetical protein [Schaalia sp. Marseille-Q2122]|uniref:hypothetical protein n=1 Tax=Schaalia sp. Marseille-Q2122 TaxID=2736604 RepID=UPI001588EA0D|nr:hypothetical protein [Schaalia sp. Marseille-Q2122]
MMQTQRFLTALAALSLASALAACSPTPPEGMLATYPELPADYHGPTCTETHTGPPTEGVLFGPFENTDPIPYQAEYDQNTQVTHNTKVNAYGHATATRHPYISDLLSVYYGFIPRGDPVIPSSPSEFHELYTKQAGDLNAVRELDGGEEEKIRYALPPRYIDGNLALGFTEITKRRVTGDRIERWLVWRCDGIWTVRLRTPPLERLPDGNVPPILDSSKNLLNTLKWVPKTLFEPTPEGIIVL